MTRTELLDAATEMLVAASKLLDRADEDTLADDALELAERVNLRIATKLVSRSWSTFPTQ